MRINKERIDKESINKGRIDKERIDKGRIEERIDKECINEDSIDKGNIDKGNIDIISLNKEYKVFREYKGLLNEMELVSKIIHSHMDEPLDQELTNTKQTPKMD